MFSLENCLSYLIHALNLITLSPAQDFYGEVSGQIPLVSNLAEPKHADYPVFEPPNAPEHKEFICEYPELVDYEFCSKPDDRACWLRPKDPKSGKLTYNISTDYENIFPKGITRKYVLDITNETLYPDGCRNTEGKVFNGSYPGPWIEACWGDDIEVTVRNHLPCNGTTIHWHGLRQYNNVENDGVNAVTQCPIAPGDSFTYKFHARQYGTSWCHSHYSLQYGDGLAGPLTIHGPASANYTTSKDPILMTDWNQRSAFEDFSWSLTNQSGFAPPKMTSILLNGTGIAPPNTATCIDRQPTKLHTLSFQKGVSYLLRLINTSVDTTFIFSIDGHNLSVIESDFVPIKPYSTNSVLIGIGQRYHVVVEASPFAPTPDGNYWIRTVPADGCSTFQNQTAYTIETSTTGIVRYDSSDADPTSQHNNFSTKCSDEDGGNLIPVFNLTVPANTISNQMHPDVRLTPADKDPYFPKENGVRRWELFKGPLWLNFSDPTLLNFAESTSTFLSELSVNTSVSAEDQWFELLITAQSSAFAAHPIHLHGHDFAILSQSSEAYDPATTVVKRNNPPRRDVALLPAGGHLLIAFKIDNPGVWLMHCHIAWHASSGLAMQILENVDRIQLHDKAALDQTCNNWNTWYNGERRTNPSCQLWDQNHFQDDSGI